MAENGSCRSEVEFETNDDETGHSKRPKMMKMKGTAIYYTKFNNAWTKMYLFIQEVQGNVYSSTVQFVIDRLAANIRHKAAHQQSLAPVQCKVTVNSMFSANIKYIIRKRSSFILVVNVPLTLHCLAHMNVHFRSHVHK